MAPAYVPGAGPVAHYFVTVSFFTELVDDSSTFVLLKVAVIG